MVWPSSVATNSNLYVAVNALQTTLTSTITSSTTPIPVLSTTAFPTVGIIVIDSEAIQYTGISGLNLTGITRGFDGTTAASHNSGAVVGLAVMAAHHNNLKTEVISTETSLYNLGLNVNLIDYGGDNTGSSYSDSAITAAFAATSSGGTVLVPAGTYLFQNTISIGFNQRVQFVGNPTLKFSLSGTNPAFVYTSYYASIGGSAIIDMQLVGGTVFQHGYSSCVTGPSEGTIQVLNPNGNVIDIGPANSSVSIANGLVQNIFCSSNIPGNFIEVWAGNYMGSIQPSPYIFGFRCVNLTASVPVSPGLVGRAVLFNLNCTGPEANFNGISFEGCNFQSGDNSSIAPVYIQSALTGNNQAVISFAFKSCVFENNNDVNAIPLIDVDSSTTAQNIWGISIDECTSYIGTATNAFSSTLRSNTRGQLSYNGANFGFIAYENVKTIDALTSGSITSEAAHPASAGAIRLGNSENVEWRNNANNGNNTLSVNTTDTLIYNSDAVITIGGNSNNYGSADQVFSTNHAGNGTTWTTVSGTSPITVTGGTGTLAVGLGTVPVADGGTNSTTSLTNGKMMYSHSGAIVEASAIDIINPGSSDATQYTFLEANFGAGNGGTYLSGYSTGSVSTGATQIAQVIDYGCLFLVTGHDGSGDYFTDLLLVSYGDATVTVIASKTALGSPAVRTYAVASSNQLTLAMASGTYKITATQLATAAY